MKEKRIDIHLSFASLLHLGIAGSVGSFVVEMSAANSRTNVLFMSFAGVVLLTSTMIVVYQHAHRKIKNKK